MRRYRNYFFCSLICISVIGFAGEKLKKGQVFPSLTLKELSGAKSGDVNRLSKKKKITLVDFWASWCKPCESSIPVLNELYSQYKDQGFLVVGVNVDENKDEGKAFAKKMNMKFPVLYDSNRKLIESVGVSTMPSSFFLDSGGKVISIHNGFRDGDKEKLEKEIKKAIN